MAKVILNPTKAQRDVVGRVWYNLILQRPCYGPIRKITRGKKKGSFEVSVLATSEEYGIHLKRKIFSPKMITFID